MWLSTDPAAHSGTLHLMLQPPLMLRLCMQGIPSPLEFGDCLQDGRVLAVLLHVLAPQAMQQPALGCVQALSA